MKTGKKRVSRRQVSVRLSHEIVTAIDDEAERTSMSRSGVVREYLEFCVDPVAWFRNLKTKDEEFERWCEQQEKEVGVPVPRI